MANKTMTLEVDLLPNTSATYNLGNSTKQWKVNGYTPGEACEKGIDSSITDSSSSTNLPTTAAVASYVGGKMSSISDEDIDDLIAEIYA